MNTNTAITKIIIASTESVACPKCGHDFPLDQGITRQTIDRYADEFELAFQERRRELEVSLQRDAERKAAAHFAGQLESLRVQVADSRQAEEEAKRALLKAREETRFKAIEEFAAEKRALADELAEKNAKLRDFHEQELALRARTRQLEEREAAMQLEFQRTLDSERRHIGDQVAQREAERFSLIEAEYKKKIEDAQQANEALRRKLEQGSQQLQGEVLELEVEHQLAVAFGHDVIEEVKKGQRGADVIQVVRLPTAQPCGRIIWEAKRAENWSDKWLAKLKEDQREAKADIAVLVTTALPTGMIEPFGMIGDVWIVSPHLMRPLAQTLRAALIEIHKLRLANTHRTEKAEQLFSYISSPGFAQQIRSMLDSVTFMATDLAAEKRAMQRIWSKRETQIESVSSTISSIVGQVNAIAHAETSALGNIEALALPDAATAAAATVATPRATLDRETAG
jgi:hypothetical protein